MPLGDQGHPAAGYIDRIVSLEEEVREARLVIRGVYDEAKGAGYTKGALRIVVKRKLESDEERQTRETIETEAEQIMTALGMLRGTPLGDAAVRANGHDAPLEDVSAYDEGKRAYKAGAEASLNPYPVGGAENDAWRDGWTDAFAAARNGNGDLETGPGEGVPTPQAEAPKRRRGRPRKDTIGEAHA